MRRREVLWLLGGGLVALEFGCDGDGPAGDDGRGEVDAGTDGGARDAEPGVDACVPATVPMHDTYAQALYLDNTLGPLTGVIEVAMVASGVEITLDFWHGHGGQQHRFTLEPSHFEALKLGHKITVGTSMVDGHAHTLFIDPLDERYRVMGAPDIAVPVGC